MRKFLTLLTLVSLLLCACGGETAPVETTTEPTTETTTEATTIETTTEATEPPILYRHPLTGEPMDKPFTGNPIAVTLNNIKAALPQHGLSGADIFYEIETEGGITRNLAIYTDLSDVGNIGPVRSTRTFFNNLAVSYSAPLAHCGGSGPALKAGYDDTGTKIQNWQHMDSPNGYFFRDKERQKQGYAREHTLFTSGEKLLACATDKGYMTTSEWDYGLQFAEGVVLNGEPASQITVTFLGKKTSSFAYDQASGKYLMSQYGKAHNDANTGEQVAFKNVLALYTKQWKWQEDPSHNRSFYDLIGEGDGYLAINGELVKIKWSRADLRAPFVYTLEDGTPVTFDVGNTYIAIASTKSEPIQYQ